MERVQDLTQAYSQAPWRKQLQFIGVFLLLVVFIALVAGIYLNVSGRTVAIGFEIQTMQKRIEQLDLSNADLETQVAMLTSTTVMEGRARDLGFQPAEPGQVLYLMVPGYLPRQTASLAPQQGARVAVAPLPRPVYSQSLFDWFSELLRQPVSFLVEANP